MFSLILNFKCLPLKHKNLENNTTKTSHSSIVKHNFIDYVKLYNTTLDYKEKLFITRIQHTAETHIFLFLIYPC